MSIRYWPTGLSLIAGFFSAVVAASAAAKDDTLMSPIPDKPKAHNFSLPDADGKTRTLGELRGKYALINFWATWCSPCVKEMPALDRQHAQLKDEGLEVVAIHAGPGEKAVGQFLEKHPLGFTVLIDDNLDLMSWAIVGLPTTYLLDPEGRLIFHAVGDRDWASAEMTEFLRSVLNSEKTTAQARDR